MGRSWNSFEMHCCKRNLKGSYGECLEESCDESLSYLRDYSEQNVGRNMDHKGSSDDNSDGNEDPLLRN
jgi:hypothetical protein